MTLKHFKQFKRYILKYYLQIFRISFAGNIYIFNSFITIADCTFYFPRDILIFLGYRNITSTINSCRSPLAADHAGR